MRLDEVAGSVETSSSDARQFIRDWFKLDELVTIIGVREKKPNRPHLIANVVNATDFYAALLDDTTLSSLCLDADGERWNLYVQVNPALHELPDPFKRGGDENVRAFRGVWVDLDVKPGSFEDEEAALNFLRGLDVFPSIVVTTGSGGVHAYWHLTEDLSPEEGRELARGWWSYLAERAAAVGASVDKLVDIARMMRLPGSVRWAKSGESGAARPVRLFYSGGQDTWVDADRLREVSRSASERRTQRVRGIRETDISRRLEADRLATELLSRGNPWLTLRAISQVEELYHGLVTWDEILEPAGWTFIREDHSGRREWARPGREDKSATTDWPESPDVMSLLSYSDETGLFDLKEAEIPLTKYRVGLRLQFNDDETAMVKWILGRTGVQVDA